jgi:hypothetical protein
MQSKYAETVIDEVMKRRNANLCETIKKTFDAVGYEHTNERDNHYTANGDEYGISGVFAKGQKNTPATRCSFWLKNETGHGCKKGEICVNVGHNTEVAEILTHIMPNVKEGFRYTASQMQKKKESQITFTDSKVFISVLIAVCEAIKARHNVEVRDVENVKIESVTA